MPKNFDDKIGKILGFFHCVTNHETGESGVHGTDYLQYYNLFLFKQKEITSKKIFKLNSSNY